ncbi:signal recognition particle protein [Mycobacterium tuberculosis]|nr:signal recognition particle protein [Mycobacterium tuberculosis]
MFESLSDRLTAALQGLRGKGRLTDADIDATTREIRLALLEADVSLPVVRAFIHRIKERARGPRCQVPSTRLNRSSRSSTRN